MSAAELSDASQQPRTPPGLLPQAPAISLHNDRTLKIGSMDFNAQVPEAGNDKPRRMFEFVQLSN